MTATHNAVKKNHYYLHETFNRIWAVRSHIYSAKDLKKMGLKEDFDWSAAPPKKYKKVKVPSLVPSSCSSSRDIDKYEDLDDTAAGPTTTNDPNNASTPPSTWYSWGALVLIFWSFWSFDDKGGEIWVSLQAGLPIWAFFLKLQLSFFWRLCWIEL